MKAIFKREVKSYFQNITGWLFLAALLFVFALYFFANNLLYGYPYVSYSLSSMKFIFLIIVPVLTMRSLSEDRKTKTDQLLFTAPVSVGQTVIGKFLAMIFVFSVGMGVICLSPLLLSKFGTVAMTEAYAAILGTWLYGVLCIAVGLFVSALTESQVIAAVLTFAFLFLGYVMEGICSLISSTGNWLTKILGNLSTVSHLDNFDNGILDVEGIIFYVSGAALFLFLTCQVIQRRRWNMNAKKLVKGAYSSLFLIIGIAVAVVVNIAGSELPDSVKNVDATSQKLYSLTDDTKNYLKELEQDITIYVLANEENADPTVEKTLERYEDASKHISVEYIDPVQSPQFYKTYTETAPSDNSVIVVSGEQSKVIDYSSLYESTVDYSTYTSQTTGYDGEGQITSAISYVVNGELPVIYTLTGHGETDLDSGFQDALEKQNYQVESLNLLETDAVPEDAAAVIMFAPTADLSQDDADKLETYLDNGGKILAATFYGTESTEHLNSLFETYGITLKDGLLMESSTQGYYQQPFYILPNIESHSYTANASSNYVFAPYAQPLQLSEEESDTLTVTALLTTSENAYIKTDIENMTTTDKEDGDETGSFAIAADAVNSETGGELIVVSDAQLFTDSADEMVAGNNKNLFKGITASFGGDETETVSIPVKEYSLSTLTVNAAAARVLGILLTICIPAGLMIAGIIIWIRRRRSR